MLCEVLAVSKDNEQHFNYRWPWFFIGELARILWFSSGCYIFYELHSGEYPYLVLDFGKYTGKYTGIYLGFLANWSSHPELCIKTIWSQFFCCCCCCCCWVFFFFFFLEFHYLFIAQCLQLTENKGIFLVSLQVFAGRNYIAYSASYD